MQRHIDRALGALVGIVLFIAAYAAAAQRAYPAPATHPSHLSVAP